MHVTKDDGIISMELTGRIDSGNASALEKEMMDLLAGHEAAELVVDADKLEYISSAGLRVLMKLRHHLGRPYNVINVSREIYDIFEITGFTELLDVRRAYREVKLDGLEQIGKGFFGKVYRIDPETIIKVYDGKDSISMIENEKKMAKKAFLSGIPTAISYDIVKAGDGFGSVFELLNAHTFNDLVINGEIPLDVIVDKYVELLKLVHGTRMEIGELPSFKDRYYDYLGVISDHLTKEQLDGIKNVLSDTKDDNMVIHGDVQMKNVMMADGEPMLIDMDTLGLGNPVYEFAGLYATYVGFEEDEPGNSMAFLGIPHEAATEIWDKTFERYFSFEDDVQRNETLDKIRLAAAIRLLYIVISSDLKNGEVGEKRIARNVRYVDELLRTVDSFNLGTVHK
ncbi:MAG: STAS domain-containing protein [Lachnospiraceae bacterium]|nr:STAS domain-containing protein [Lachnospiraceae bacterium]